MFLLLQKRAIDISSPGESTPLQQPISHQQQGGQYQPTTYRPPTPYLHLQHQQQSILPPVQRVPQITHRQDQGSVVYQQQRAQLAQQLLVNRGLLPQGQSNQQHFNNQQFGNNQQYYTPQIVQQHVVQVPTIQYQQYQQRVDQPQHLPYNHQIYQQQYHEQQAYNQLLQQQRLYEEQQLRERLSRNYNRFDLTPNNPAALIFG